ncbi:MAG TPA: hypothetical protein VFH77_14695 [Streptomyces sp.]|nr:hypothetical protein [Streptomyces sp.]
MARKSDIAVVSHAELERIWDENAMSQKLRTGLLIEIIVPQGPAKNPRYAGGASRIVKVRTPSGQHIGTLHEIVGPSGDILHRHPHDYTLRDCSRVRIADRNDPP